ncbi:unnamed protein product [Heligmosomoides polygyrus]|uniref:Fungal_trans domain-containing protein n=1 Tax=Heligmosomoides polygyrus TaxID=6339 RepID=A0A3P8DHG0_HELPZ|nr:unnamed protein product [Heligmosomoides polygyrus]
MESIDLEREVEKMLALENANDNRFATLQSQMSTLVEQVQALTKQAAEKNQPMELGEDSTDFRTVMRAAQLVDIGLPNEDPLHLLYPCDCSIFKTKAQTALPSLRSDLARSKPVNNTFELANVASIVLDPFWGDRRKEEELMVKDSKHLTILGLAHAIAAHRSSCYKFNSALRAAAGKRIVHPALFLSFPGYNIESYYAQAVKRLDQIPRDYDDSPVIATIIALALAFLRAQKNLEETDKARIMCTPRWMD